MPYTILVRQRQAPLTKGSEEMETMSDAALNKYLESIAKLIEAKATTPEEAAAIVRESKVEA